MTSTTSALYLLLYLCGAYGLASNILTSQKTKTIYNQPLLDKGVNNSGPTARYGTVKWIDEINQELWLFGGHSTTPKSGSYTFSAPLTKSLNSLTLGHLNDLWRYRASDATWTKLYGGLTKKGIYGKKGISSTKNMPGGRHFAFGWYDRFSQEFWLFGGYGYGVNSTKGIGA